jgi:fructose/tagatose bisphosphate aldolase
MQLALHGSTGVPPEMLTACIERGVTKVNVNKAYLVDYMTHFRQDSPTQPLTQFMEESIPLVQRRLEDLIKLCGSDGKAGSVGVE